MYQLAGSDAFLQNLRSSFAAQSRAHSEILGDFHSLWHVFVEALNSLSTTRFILSIDALDECPESQRKILLEYCLRLQSELFRGSIRLILTCRSKHHFLPIQLRADQQIWIGGAKLLEDLNLVVTKRVDALHRYKSYDPGLRKSIKEELLKRGNGSHLWIALAVRELEHTEPSNALQRLRAIPGDLFAIYDEILDRVPASHAAEVRFLLNMRLAAFVDLTVMDVAVARSLLPGNDVIFSSNLQHLVGDTTRPSPTEVWERKQRFEMCTDLMSIDTHGVIDFIHPTVADYLLQAKNSNYECIGSWMAIGLAIIFVLALLNLVLSKIQLTLVLLKLAVLTCSWMKSDCSRAIVNPVISSMRLHQCARILPGAASLWFVRDAYRTNVEQVNLCAFQVAFQSIPASSVGIEEDCNPSIVKLRRYAMQSLQIHASRCQEHLIQLFPWQATCSQDKAPSLECWLKQEAACNGSLIDKILEIGTDVDTCIELFGPDDRARTPLIVAALNGNMEATLSLVIAGATIDWQDSTAMTALHHAVLERHKGVVASLLQAGADVNIADDNGRPPFISVLKQQSGLLDTTYEETVVRDGSIAFVGDIDVVNQAAMANCSWLDSTLRFPHPECEDIILALVENGADLSAQDQSGQTLVLVAAMNHRWRLVDNLLDRGANPDTIDHEGFNALLRALWSPRTLQYIHNSVVRDKSRVWLGSAIIFDRPTSESASTPTRSDYSCEYAATVISKLIIKTSNLELRGPAGRTALSIAAENGHLETVMALQNRGADANATDDHGMNPLMWACRQPRFRKLLVDNLVVRDESTVIVGTVLINVVRDTSASQKNENVIPAMASHLPAMRQERLRIITRLASQTRDMNTWDNHGLCALYHARDQEMYGFASHDIDGTMPEDRTSVSDRLKAHGATRELAPDINAPNDWESDGHIYASHIRPDAKMGKVTLRGCSRVVASLSAGVTSRLGLKIRQGNGIPTSFGVPNLVPPEPLQTKNGRLQFTLASPREMARPLDLCNCVEMPWNTLRNIVLRDHCKFAELVLILSVESSGIKIITEGSTQQRPGQYWSIIARDHAEARFAWAGPAPGSEDGSHNVWPAGGIDTPVHALIESLFQVYPDHTDM